MIRYPDIDKVAVAIGPVSIHWYGLMYVIGFVAAWLLLRYRAARPGSGWSRDNAEDLVFYGIVGLFVGARLFYMLVYGFDQLRENPLDLFKVWEGGMSFHGGLLGVLIAMGLYGRRHGRGFFEVTDFIAPVIPPGLCAGRIGNFINGELWGKVSDVPWAFYWDGDAVARPDLAAVFEDGPRHPSQLYEAALEGVALFVILWVFSSRPRPTMAVSGLFLLGYGVFRFGIEFVRVPDSHLGYLAFGWVTMGQVLTLPMIIAGAVLLALAYGRRGEPAASGAGTS